MDFYKVVVPKLLPAVAAVVLFFAVSVLYFAPQFEGEVLPQHDVQQYEGMSKDIKDNRAATGEDPQWTGAMFGGMPAYLITVAYPAQLVKATFGRIVDIMGTPAGFVFFSMLSMWLMLLIIGVNPWVGIVPSLAYGLSTYFFLIIGAGHITKMWALVYAPLMMGGAFMTMRRNMWAGAAVTALCTSLEIGVNHPQITYYFLLAMAAFWVSELIFAVKGHKIKDFARRTAFLVIAGILAVGSNFSPLWYTAQHSKDTMRGGSELATTTETSADGLALDYATAWSYGKAESWNMLIPDFMGGSSATTFSADGEVASALAPYGLSSAAEQLPAYWGTQPYTAGPTYIGAVAIFLAVLGICLVKGRNKWWGIAISVIMIFFSWGSNFISFTEFAFKYLPGYNKFRTVSMALVVVEWTVPLLGALAIMRLWKSTDDRRRTLHALAWAAGVVGGVCLIFAVAGSSMFDFGREASTEMMTRQFYQMFKASGMDDYIAKGAHEELGVVTAGAMAKERAEIMSADAWRSLIMVMLAAGGVLLFAMRKIKRGVLVGILGVFVFMDMIPVNMRFMPQSMFVSARRQQITATDADKYIMQDKDPAYRVLNLTVSPFNDATTSYFHRSVGGYHGAKLARYQDVIDKYLVNMDAGVLDMLNTRYVIRYADDGSTTVDVRESANGAAWFVGGIVRAAGASAEIDSIGVVDTKTVAVIDKTTDVGLSQFGTGEISLKEYRPNYLKYEYTADAPAFAVFSEIFYNKGWKAYVDGVEIPYVRADYILRAAELPAGSHVVEWKFRAPDWNIMEGITLVCSLIIILGVIAVTIYLVRNERRQKTQA